ncbi:ABC transporter ATP-binding protein [Kitasatospora camelliae]|uniref:ABC transporter ATP-binding protein n=1 Tax=Kitasatospora camelliae TaxID=3156397 RepID=A0AAU8JYI9_9ACTN
MTSPGADPGRPDSRSARRYLWWLVVSQPRRSAAGALLGTLWMVGMTLPPYLLSRAVDDGLLAHRPGVLAGWAAAMLGLGVVTALVGSLRHRTMTRIRMDAHFRTVRVVVRQAVRLGAELPRQAGAGEVVTIGITDVARIAMTLTVVGPGFGAVMAYLVVAGQLLRMSALLAAVVLLGVPLAGVLVGPLFGRLRGVEAEYRQRQGALAARFEDLVGGLRVLNGLGGKEEFAERYRRDSRRLREDGYRVGAVTSWLQAVGAGLPVLVLAAVLWPAARLAAQGQITVGQLVSVYGYVAVLVLPVYFFVQCGQDISRGLVSADRVVRFLALEPAEETADREDAEGTAEPPEGPAALHDPVSGLTLAPGAFTVLAAVRSAEAAAVVERLGRFTGSPAVWGPVRLDAVDRARLRERIVVADNEAALFAGTLRELLSGRHERADAELLAALEAAAALDVLRGLPHGLDSVLLTEGRNLSGGQRQRLRLARALLAEPEVLLAVEPTSAVDAHTEAAMAAGLRTARLGRTTLVTSTSPLLLDLADTVCFLADGRVAATGRHRDLLREQPGYRALVARGQDADDPSGDPSPAPARPAEEALR